MDNQYMLSQPFLRYTIPFGKSRGRVWSPVDVAFLPNGNIVVAEYQNRRLQLFDPEGNVVRVIGEGKLWPQGVATTGRGNILVTDIQDDCVKVFTPTGKYVSSWIKGIYGWPSAIAVSSIGNVIVSDLGYNRHCVSIHTPDGQGASIFGSLGNRDITFCDPRYLATNGAEHIYVSDCWNHCIKVFNTSKHFLYKFGTKGSGDGQLKYPHGVCVDMNGNVIVADNGNDRITMFDRAGKFVKHLVTSRQPHGVAVKDNGLLAVTESDPKVYHSAVKLYRLYATKDK